MSDIVDRLDGSHWCEECRCVPLQREAKAEIERLRAQTNNAIGKQYDAEAEIERLREEECEQHNNITKLTREIERLRAALADVLPLAERYVGRSDGQPNATYDRLANARRALEARKE